LLIIVNARQIYSPKALDQYQKYQIKTRIHQILIEVKRDKTDLDLELRIIWNVDQNLNSLSIPLLTKDLNC